MAETTPRIRLRPIPDDFTFVVRGGDPRPEILEPDAQRFRRRFPEWGRFGVSAFAAVDLAEAAVLGRARLANFASITMYRQSDLVRVGLEVVPTFRRPHLTIAHADLGALVAALRACEHVVIPNPAHAGGDGDE